MSRSKVKVTIDANGDIYSIIAEGDITVKVVDGYDLKEILTYPLGRQGHGNKFICDQHSGSANWDIED